MCIPRLDLNLKSARLSLSWPPWGLCSTLCQSTQRALPPSDLPSWEHFIFQIAYSVLLTFILFFLFFLFVKHKTLSRKMLIDEGLAILGERITDDFSSNFFSFPFFFFFFDFSVFSKWSTINVNNFYNLQNN